MGAGPGRALSRRHPRLRSPTRARGSIPPPVPEPIRARPDRRGQRPGPLPHPQAGRRRRVQRARKHHLHDPAPPVGRLGPGARLARRARRRAPAPLALRRPRRCAWPAADDPGWSPGDPRGRRAASRPRRARLARAGARGRGLLARGRRGDADAGSAGGPRGVLPLARRHARRRAAARIVAEELSSRYEEIDLLYAISEILGQTVRLEEAARTILREVSTRGRRPARVDHGVRRSRRRAPDRGRARLRRRRASRPCSLDDRVLGRGAGLPRAAGHRDDPPEPGECRPGATTAAATGAAPS